MLPEIDQQQLAEVRAAAEVMVVDVREADEYRRGHVPGAR
ncbi:rhodanese-like domain-containing protein [Pseudonocardia sp. N23]|nr:rhodanese-like domain-containing protein [Pseudonocardia sp. N23]